MRETLLIKKLEKSVVKVKREEDIWIKKLSQHAKKFLEEEFEIDEMLPIVFNGRLYKSVGRFVSYGCTCGHTTHGKECTCNSRHKSYIEMSPRGIAQVGLMEDKEFVYKILEHELVHYARWYKGLPYKDSDKEFANDCVTRDIPLSVAIPYVYHEYQCENGHKVGSRKKYDTSKYVCGKCNAKIHYTKKRLARLEKCLTR